MKMRRGDTLIEVMLAVAVFGMVAIGAIKCMNLGLFTAQTSLEVTMARNEIDAQAEALRFIHNAIMDADEHADESEISDNYRKVWNQIVKKAVESGNVPSEFFEKYNGEDCESIYNGGGALIPGKSFAINTRALDENSIGGALASNNVVVTDNPNTPISDKNLQVSPTYPRLIYGTMGDDGKLHIGNLTDDDTELKKAQGIYVTAVASANGKDCGDAGKFPNYYDFYVRTCWYKAGGGQSTISSIVRLHNPSDPVALHEETELTMADLEWSRFDHVPTTEHDQRNSHDQIPAGQPHTTFNGNNVSLVGYGISRADEGTYMWVSGDNDADGSDFTLSGTFNPGTFTAHPYGVLMIRLGPIAALLHKQNDSQTGLDVEFVYIPTGENFDSTHFVTSGSQGNTMTHDLEEGSTNYNNGIRKLNHATNLTGNVSFEIQKTGGTYTLNVGGVVAQIDTSGSNYVKTNGEVLGSTSGNKYLVLGLIHSTHNCEKIYNIQFTVGQITQTTSKQVGTECADY